MPKNNGRVPPFELVDVVFRNNRIKRGIDPTKWRWKPWDFEADFDIMRWQRSMEGEKNKK